MTDNLKIKSIKLGQFGYPTLLGLTNLPPRELYYIGNLPENISIACIGIRQPTEFGLQVCSKITEVFVNNGFSIISGLARGIDTQAHKTALKLGGHTVAVVSSGLDIIYPKENTDLFNEIIDSGGCVISEYPEGTPVSKTNLLNRNRIITGLSLGTVCMQAKLNGGSIGACKHTLAQSRPLFFPAPPEALRLEDESEANLLFEIDNPLVPMELMPVKPLDYYNYDFLDPNWKPKSFWGRLLGRK